MLLTDRFVFIHMPKTGGTFVTEVLERLHRPKPPTLPQRLVGKARGLLGRPRRSRYPYGELHNLEPKHGTCHDIPPGHRGKTILSSVRSPHEWYVSQYEFAWWRRTHLYNPNDPSTPAGHAIERVLPAFAAEHPHFPDISFAEFMDLCDRAARVYDPDGRSGLYTHGFARYYFKAPAEALATFAPEYFRSGAVKRDMFDVRFIHTEALNRQLADFLRGQGYRKKDLAFIEGLGKILPEGRGRREDQLWSNYYTPALRRQVRQNDWALYELFPAFF